MREKSEKKTMCDLKKKKREEKKIQKTQRE
jgi:hypothetical protein